MSLSVLEVLQNAKFNLESSDSQLQKYIGIQQLHNAIAQLEEDPDAEKEYKKKNKEQRD